MFFHERVPARCRVKYEKYMQKGQVRTRKLAVDLRHGDEVHQSTVGKDMNQYLGRTSAFLVVAYGVL